MKLSLQYILGPIIMVFIFAFVFSFGVAFHSPENVEDAAILCSVHDPMEEGPLYLVCTGSGAIDTVDAYGQDRLLGKQEEYGYASFGGSHDENSGSSYTVMQMPDDAETWVSINNGDKHIDRRDLNGCFCEECTEKISAVLEKNQRHSYVLYDAVAGEYHSIFAGTEQIGNYIVETTREDRGYHMVVTTLE